MILSIYFMVDVIVLRGLVSIPQLSELNSFQFSRNYIEKGLSRLGRGMQVLTIPKTGD